MLGRCGKKKLCACVEKKKVKTASVVVVVVGMEEVCLKWMKKMKSMLAMKKKVER